MYNQYSLCIRKVHLILKIMVWQYIDPLRASDAYMCQ